MNSTPTPPQAALAQSIQLVALAMAQSRAVAEALTTDSALPRKPSAPQQ